MESLTVASGTPPCRVEITLLPCGQDLSVTILGGSRPHIGASALALPRPSLADPAKPSASESVLCVPGHKDDVVAKEAAHRLATAFGCTVNVCAGLHLDNATPEDIADMMAAFHTALDEALAQWEGESGKLTVESGK